MKAKDIAPLIQICFASFGGKTPTTPVVEFATAAELGRGIDGRYFGAYNRVWIRKNPSSCTAEFCLAHELAHVWQKANDLPMDEDQADRMAGAALGYSHYPWNKI